MPVSRQCHPQQAYSLSPWKHRAAVGGVGWCPGGVMWVWDETMAGREWDALPALHALCSCLSLFLSVCLPLSRSLSETIHMYSPATNQTVSKKAAGQENKNRMSEKIYLSRRNNVYTFKLQLNTQQRWSDSNSLGLQLGIGYVCESVLWHSHVYEGIGTVGGNRS